MVSGPSPRPLIGLVLRNLAPERVRGWAVDAIGIQRNYVDSIERAGAIPLLISPHSATAANDLLSILDALVLPGGDDLDPSSYADHRHSAVYGTDLDVDLFEFDLAREALRRALPTLAICRGAQLVNVALGGTLHQDIGALAAEGAHGIPGRNPIPSLHAIAVEPDSRLVSVLQTTTTTAVCHHHQAINRLGHGLRVVARAPDGIIEAVESTELPSLVAVQWHPEETAASDPVQQRLFDSLVALAAEAGA